MREDFPDLLAAAREGDDAAFTTLFRSVQSSTPAGLPPGLRCRSTSPPSWPR